MKHSIIFASILISGAILLNGYFDRAARNPNFSRPSNKQVKTSVVKSFEYAFKALEGDNIIMDKKRDVREIQIVDISYSDGNKRMLVNFSLKCADGEMIQSGIGLNRDEFGVYRGGWDFGKKKANFEIKKEG